MRVYLDMDGVLCNFADSVLERMNRYSTHTKLWDSMNTVTLKAMEEAILKVNRNTFVLNDIIPGIGSDESMNYMYRTIDGDINFWADLSWLEEGKKLWKYLKNHKDLYLLTAPHDDASIHGKKYWIKYKLNFDTNKVIFEKQKEKHASNNSVLIDDMPKNINKFISAGGNGFIHEDTKTTIYFLKTIL